MGIIKALEDEFCQVKILKFIWKKIKLSEEGMDDFL